MHMTESLIVDRAQRGVNKAPEQAIEVLELVKQYTKSKTKAVDGITFSVRRGEIFGLLGPNGAGKTTTIGVLTTSVVPTSGRAAIMGIDVARDPISIKQRIAVVPQQSNLDRSLMVREILTFHAAYHRVPRKEREALADKLLDELGLGDRKNEKVNRYSGGMTQRIMIARALMHAPDVLFLDEPTNNLDPQSRLFLWDRILELNQQGLTILLTTHDMDEADRLCQRIAIMDLGKILVNDTPAELKKLIPGGNSLELHVRLPDGDTGAVRAFALEALRALPGVSKVDEVDEIPAPAAVPAAPRGPFGGAVLAAPAPPQQELGVVTFRIFAEAAGALVGPAAQAVLGAGAEVRDLHVKRPSLEDVFIYLTGRHLR